MKQNFAPIYIALASATLFGASTPAAKLLLGHVDAPLLAGLLYLGSGLGLLACIKVRKALKLESGSARVRAADWPWLIAAVTSGGIIAPLLLMIGLKTTLAGTASLLLNLEAVFTSLLAWFAFKENFDRRIFLGMVAIVGGSVLLTWQPGTATGLSAGALAVIAACFCWALDNNFTRNISQCDPLQIAALKGLAAGSVNCVVALACGSMLPAPSTILVIATIGFLGYGVSLVLFITALRFLGTARTGAYFSTAPFAGALLSLAFLHDRLSTNLLMAGGLMALGLWLHLTENHNHAHSHPEEEHEHWHRHDEHHNHHHDFPVEPGEEHVHWHRHEAITHAHAHFPDSAHRHDH